MEAQGDEKKPQYIVPTKQVKCLLDVKKWENSEAYQVKFWSLEMSDFVHQTEVYVRTYLTCHPHSA